MSRAAPTFDLQSHSVFSDGELAPREVVSAAFEAGVELVALTDHDSLDGVEAASDAADELGIGFVTAVEISTIDAVSGDLHILGYRIDPGNERLGDQLARSRGDREHRAERMMAALTELGWAIDEAPLKARTAAGKTIGRPHLAEAVVSHPDNTERLTREGLLEPTPFLVAYLIDGKPAFRERQAPSVPDAIDLIHGAGGVAVWAHPFWDVEDPEVVDVTVDRFREAGLDGIEAFYVTHTREQTELLADRCARDGLLSTGSSDFHGPGHRMFHRFRAFDTYGRTPDLGPIAA